MRDGFCFMDISEHQDFFALDMLIRKARALRKNLSDLDELMASLEASDNNTWAFL